MNKKSNEPANANLITIRDFYNFALHEFQKAQIETPALDASVILADFLERDRSYLLINEEKEIPEKERNSLLKKIQERSMRRPVSQITEKKEFYGYSFFVNEDVLSPRPETEEMVERILREDLSENALVLDLCSGSGCIGITLLMERPGWKCHFSDLSEKTIGVLVRNGETLVKDFSTRSRIFTGNLYEPIENAFSAADSKNIHEFLYDAILSNPPYIHPDEKNDLMPELAFEPQGALFTEDLPGIYFKILDGANKLLKNNGILICELSPRWAETVLEYGNQFMDGNILIDLSGLERFVFFKKRMKKN